MSGHLTVLLSWIDYQLHSRSLLYNESELEGVELPPELLHKRYSPRGLPDFVFEDYPN